MADLELLKNLNTSQLEAVTHRDGPLLIVAGAGTGKTTVITSKIGWLILDQGIKPDEILSLTFTEKAASEMEERVDKLLPMGYVDLWISTFHSFAERIVREHALDIGLNGNFKLLSETEQWLLIRRNLDRFNLDYYRPLGNPVKFIHALLTVFSRAKDEEISPEDYLNYVSELKLNSDSIEFVTSILPPEDIKNLPPAEAKALFAEEILKQQEIAEAYQVYQKLLVENNALDFGDLINYVLKLLKTRKGILAKYRAKFKYILVDEFQDTNWAQYELVKLLASPHNDLTVVGDDDQSIYKFRGASISNIMQFKDDFPQAKEIFLIDNYRSSQNILDLSYNFIQNNNPDRLEVKLSTDAGTPLSKKLISHHQQNGTIEHLFGQTLSDEVELVVNKIIDLYNADPETNWSDFAILVRAKKSADDFIEALDLARLPYLYLANKGLYRLPLILDLISWFKCLDDYHEGPAMYRVLNFNSWNLKHQDIINLVYWAKRKGVSLFEICKQAELYQDISAETKKQLTVILDFIERQTILASNNKKTSEIMLAFLSESGWLKQLSLKESISANEQLRALNLFLKRIIEFEKNSPTPTLKEFLSLLDLELEAGEEGSLSPNFDDLGPDSIRIMTIHGSKGLEFKYVFIVNLVDKKFPTISKSDSIQLPEKLTKEILPEGDSHLQEERRLFYVAMTRAKEGLFLSSAIDYGGKQKKKPSRFLIELQAVGLDLKAESLSSTHSPLEDDVVEHTQTEAPKPVLPLPEHFSYTQLAAFEKCPYQYRFAHVLQIPTIGKGSFSFGKTMHTTLEKFFMLANQKKNDGSDAVSKKSADLPTWEECLSIYEQAFIDDWYKDQADKQKYYDRGLKSFQEFYEAWIKEPMYPVDLELGFTFKLGPKYVINGKIDRVDQLEDGVRLVDYKTGEPKTSLAPEDKEQLLIYQLAAESLGKKVKSLQFHYLKNNTTLEFLGKPAELEKLQEKLITRIDAIRAGDFPPNNTEHTCRSCDFKHICNFAS